MRRRKSGNRRASEKSLQKEAPTVNRSKLIDTEDAATGAVGMGVYIAYFKSIGFALGITAVTCNALMQASSVYSGSNYLSFSSQQLQLNSINLLVYLSLAHRLVDRSQSK